MALFMKHPLLFAGIGSDTAFVTPGDSMAPNFDHRHITNIKYYYIFERKKR